LTPIEIAEAEHLLSCWSTTSALSLHISFNEQVGNRTLEKSASFFSPLRFIDEKFSGVEEENKWIFPMFFFEKQTEDFFLQLSNLNSPIKISMMVIIF
jgi:hypothetical protein